MKELLRPYLLKEDDRLIRLGRDTDGGYLIPESVCNAAKALVSFGIGDEYSFERDWVAKNPENYALMHDHTVELKPKEDRIWFHPVKATSEVLGKITIDGPYVLKLDIEGDEYACLSTLRADSHCVAVIIVEFHWIFKHADALRSVVTHLENLGFKIVHVHGNNHGRLVDGFPKTVEATFVNTAFIPVGERFRGKLPLPGLDFPNNPDAPDYEMDFS
jgi:methyltransferase FkbM-like protein